MSLKLKRCDPKLKNLLLNVIQLQNLNLKSNIMEIEPQHTYVNTTVLQ
jgi:hypothetical protein